MDPTLFKKYIEDSEFPNKFNIEQLNILMEYIYQYYNNNNKELYPELDKYIQNEFRLSHPSNYKNLSILYSNYLQHKSLEPYILSLSVPSVPEPSVPVPSVPVPSVPEPSEPSVPEPSEPSVPEPSEPSVPEPSEPSVPEPSEPSVPEETPNQERINFYQEVSEILKNEPRLCEFKTIRGNDLLNQRIGKGASSIAYRVFHPSFKENKYIIAKVSDMYEPSVKKELELYKRFMPLVFQDNTIHFPLIWQDIDCGRCAFIKPEIFESREEQFKWESIKTSRCKIIFAEPFEGDLINFTKNVFVDIPEEYQYSVLYL